MFTLSDIMQGNDGKIRLESALPPDPELVFRSAHHDSRRIGPGDLFVAIKGAKVDGHTFIPEVARAGALGALCTEPVADVPPHFLQFVVPNVVDALVATARTRVQRQQHTTMIGITGSNGKTTTKEAVASILSQRISTLKTYASYNNEIGLPLTLLQLEPHHRFAVLEMGADHVGELAWLCSIVRPDWSIVTSVGSAHLESFGSPERVAIAKGELVEALASDGTAILNYDDLRVRAMNQRTKARVVYYGMGEGAEVRASEIGGNSLYGHSFTLSYREMRSPIQLHLPGKHGINIALAAATAGFLADLSLDDICSGLASLSAIQGRDQLKRGPNDSVLIDDSYNANSQSILAAIDMMKTAHIPAEGKRWAVLGDILELGKYARDEHYAVGQALPGAVDYLVAIGDYARFYVEGAQNAGMPAARIHFFAADLEDGPAVEAAKREAARTPIQHVKSSDLLLLKGSNLLRMFTMLEMF
ncbi:MAG TPA: UDP-N-acetylmuramoyl-tripeptide--D-alanyl-D-alanine ligase [Ktedonobacteraceae bacterium]